MTTAQETALDTPPAAARGRWWPLVAICLGTFMLLVDVTIVSVALPSMSRELNTQLSSLQWVVDAYALALAALLLLSGSLADRFGRRRLFQAGLILFAAASLGCALAPTAGLLIAARAVQGAGAAAMFATNTALLSATYDGRDRSVAFGVWGAVNGAAAAVAPVLGGLLIGVFGWRSIFLVNLPVAAVAIALTWRVLSESRGRPGPIDWAGAITFTACAGAVTFALIHGGEAGWATPATLGTLAAGAAALIAFVAVERRRGSPLLDLALLRQRSFGTLMAAAILLTAAAFAPTVYTQLWLQSALNLTAIKAGLVLLPMAGAAFAVSAGGGRFLHRVPPQLPLGAGLLLIGAGALLRTTFSAQSSWPALIPGLVVAGVGVGLASPVLVSAALAAAPRERAGMAAGAVNTFRQLGYALGIAVLGTVFASRLGHTIAGSGLFADPRLAAAQASQGQAQAVIGTAPLHQRLAVSHVVDAAFVAGQNHIYFAAGLAALIGGAAVLALVRPASQPRAGAAPAGTRPARPAVMAGSAASSPAAAPPANAG